jgi:hypothetical protein
MHLRSWLLLYRKRLIASAIFALLANALVLYGTSPCGCDPNALDPNDARTLLQPFVLATFPIAVILGMSLLAQGNLNGIPGTSLFLLTRPIPRRALILQPLLIAAIALAILPPLSWLVILAALKPFHPIWLNYTLTLTHLIPSVAALGPDPSLAALISAMHLVRAWVASLSTGLCLYTLFAAQRWILLTTRKSYSLLAVLPLFLLLVVGPLLTRPGRPLTALLFLTTPASQPLTYIPSLLAIALHLAFAALILALCWRQLDRAEL